MYEDLWWAGWVVALFMMLALWWFVGEVDRMDEAQRWVDRILDESESEE